MNHKGPGLNLGLTSLRLTSLGLLGLLLAGLAQAEPAWVNDRLFLSLYPEPDSGTERLTLLESGDELERLGEEEGNFVRVRTANGREGWVNRDFLVDSPPARIRIEGVETERDELAARLSEQEAETERLRQDLASMEAERDRAQQALLEVEAETEEPPETGEDRPEESPPPATQDPAAEQTSGLDLARLDRVTALTAAGLGLLVLGLGGLAGYLIKEYQIRRKFGGMSL